MMNKLMLGKVQGRRADTKSKLQTPHLYRKGEQVMIIRGLAPPIPQLYVHAVARKSALSIVFLDCHH